MAQLLLPICTLYKGNLKKNQNSEIKFQIVILEFHFHLRTKQSIIKCLNLNLLLSFKPSLQEESGGTLFAGLVSSQARTRPACQLHLPSSWQPHHGMHDVCLAAHSHADSLSCCHCLFLATLMSFKPLCQCQTYGGKEEFASSVFTSYTASSSCKLWGVGVPWGSSRNIQDYCNEKTAANSSKSLDFFIVLLANNLCCYSLCFCSWKNRVVLQILSDL